MMHRTLSHLDMYEYVSIMPQTTSSRKSDLKCLDLQICPGFPDTLLSDGDSVYSCENLFENVGTPEKSCLMCTGTPMKTCCKSWH